MAEKAVEKSVTHSIRERGTGDLLKWSSWSIGWRVCWGGPQVRMLWQLRLISALRTLTTCCCQMQNIVSVQPTCSKIPAVSTTSADIWDQSLGLILKLLASVLFLFEPISSFLAVSVQQPSLSDLLPLKVHVVVISLTLTTLQNLNEQDAILKYSVEKVEIATNDIK